MMFKLFIFVVIVAQVAASPLVKSNDVNARKEAPTQPTLAEKCEKESDKCVHPASSDPFEKPDDCSHYYQCSNGYLCTMPCPDGLVFNPEIKVCDWPWNVAGCEGEDPTPSPPEASYNSDCLNAVGKPVNKPPFANPEDCDSFFMCWRGYRYEFSCPFWFVFNPSTGCCDWPIKVDECRPTFPPKPTQPPYNDECLDANGKPVSGNPFEKPGDCDNFYQCSNGYLHTMPCAPGTVFNPAIGVCDHPYNVPKCGGTTTTKSTTTTTTAETPPPFDDECLDANGKPVSGNPFEKPGDCDNFYQCSNGYLHTMPCAPGTVFNPAIGVCDHPYNVPKCGGTTTTKSTTTTTTAETPPPFDDECFDANGKPVSGNPFEKPGDCDNFYQCSNGYLHTMPCAPGTVFNPAIGVCDHPYNVPKCGGTTTTKSTTTTTTAETPPPFDDECLDANGKPVSGNPFEKPGDCDNFYQCSNGYLHTMPCASGTVFNPAIGVCDHPYNVPKCGGTTTTKSTTTTTTAETPPPFDDECLDANGKPVSGNPFEKPGDCDNFYQCSNGYLHTMPCAPGTVFNPAIGVCDHPYNVPKCGGTTTTKSTTTTTTAETPPPFDDECLDANGKPVSGNPFEKPGDCDNFYQCSNGYLHTMPCAPGTVFNPAIGVCDHPYNVPKCGGTTTTKSTTTTTTAETPPPFDDECLDANGKPVSGNPFEKPGDCDNFYQCSNGYLHTMPCASGTVFNPAIGVCDHPYNVPKCGGTTTTKSTTTTTTAETPPPFDDECLDANGKPVSGNPFEKPGDCDNFYQCSNGYLHTMPCAPGTVFNPAIGVCDHPYNVPKCGGTTTTKSTTTTTTAETPPPFDDECLDANGKPVSGNPFEKPGDCDNFYQCSNGYLHTMPCAPGTVFNPAIGVCDHPYNVPKCGGTTTTKSTTTTTTAETPPPFDDECLDANGKPVSGNPFEKPGDCDNFYQCSNGYLHTMPCAPGTVFNPAIGVCDHPYNVPKCGGTTTTKSTTTTTTAETPPPFDDECLDANGKPVSGNPFEKPGDCDNFYQCSNGYLHTMPCAPGTVFNPAIGVCDHPYNVPKCGGTTTTKSTTTTTTAETPPPFDDECLDANGKPVSGNPFEKPGDCDNFYQCSNGYLHTMPCAPGTVFNPAIGVCDHPYNVPKCGGTTTTKSTTTTTTAETPPPFDDECLDANGKPVSGNPFEKPGDCDNFYQCSNGYLHTMPCAPGTVFNPAIGVCDHPYNVPKCGGTTTTKSTTTTTTAETPPPFDDECIDANGKPVSGNPFEKPGDCDNFYQCSNGYLHTMPCAPGTVFNPAIGVCDHPYNVPKCGGTTTTKSTTTTTTAETPPPFDDECIDANGKPVSGNPFEKPGDCDNFYQCSNGYLHTMPCAPGTVFNPAIGVCDHPYNVPKCGGTTTTKSTTTTTTAETPPPFDDECLDANGKPVSGNPFEKPGDCDNFYQCSNGYLHTMPCAPGTVFNPAIGVCDHPYNVPKCGGTTTTKSTTTTTTAETPPPFDGIVKYVSNC
ncbi:uncharacterized protein LOC143468590 [Clavelina lepadiformis]|uniref:uncharacterized protein LOC143468590 n=1 Tax=Clavelina lepadiformis TaxID=159417 RepID=UPI004042D01E